MSVFVRVPGKVNLALCVGTTDDAGYHQLSTVFQAVSLCDEILAERLPAGEFQLSFLGEGSSFLPVDDTNLAMKAAKLVVKHYEVPAAGVSLRIRKRIPVAGGMAGGSADAAGTLLACAQLWGIPVDREELRGLAAQLGSDIPFLLLGGTVHGTGRGEVLSPIQARGVYHWVFALSHNGLSTPSVFKKFDALSQPQDMRLPDGLVDALAVGEVRAVGELLRNDLQQAAIALQPSLERTLEIGVKAGALGAIVSGSGPTCAFLAENEEDAKAIAQSLNGSSAVRAVRVAKGPVAGAQHIFES